MTFTSFEKMSKKNKAALNKSQRVEWAFNPASRVKPSKKVYSRKNKWGVKNGLE